MPPLEDGRGEARLGQIGGGHKAVMTPAHYAHVILGRRGATAQTSSIRPTKFGLKGKNKQGKNYLPKIYRIVIMEEEENWLANNN